MRSCFGGVGFGDVVDILNPQVARRINGILVRDITHSKAQRERGGGEGCYHSADSPGTPREYTFDASRKFESMYSFLIVLEKKTLKLSVLLTRIVFSGKIFEKIESAQGLPDLCMVLLIIFQKIIIIKCGFE